VELGAGSGDGLADDGVELGDAVVLLDGSDAPPPPPLQPHSNTRKHRRETALPAKFIRSAFSGCPATN
jgi:hypothetical protein